MLEVDELVILFLEAQHFELPCVDEHLSNLEEHLTLIAAETGMDREGCYCPERHMEDVLENFRKENS